MPIHIYNFCILISSFTKLVSEILKNKIELVFCIKSLLS